MRKAQITDKTSKIKGILRISNKKIPLGHKKKKTIVMCKLMAQPWGVVEPGVKLYFLNLCKLQLPFCEMG